MAPPGGDQSGYRRHLHLDPGGAGVEGSVAAVAAGRRRRTIVCANKETSEGGRAFFFFFFFVLHGVVLVVLLGLRNGIEKSAGGRGGGGVVERLVVVVSFGRSAATLPPMSASTTLCMILSNIDLSLMVLVIIVVIIIGESIYEGGLTPLNGADGASNIGGWWLLLLMIRMEGGDLGGDAGEVEGVAALRREHRLLTSSSSSLHVLQAYPATILQSFNHHRDQLTTHYVKYKNRNHNTIMSTNRYKGEKVIY